MFHVLLADLIVNRETIIMIVAIAFIALFIRTLLDIQKFPFIKPDAKSTWFVYLVVFSLPAMIIWWLGRTGRTVN